MKPTPDTWIVHAGRVCFGLGIAGLGIQHFVIANFVAVAIPFRVASTGLPNALGVLLLLAGAGICLGRAVRPVCLLMGAFFVVAFVFAHLPDAFAQWRKVPAGTPAWQVMYLGTTPLKALVFAGGAWLIASLYPGGTPRSDRFLRMSGAYTLGFFLLYCGIEHFIYLDFVAALIANWIPAHVFWAKFAGGALIAGGLGLLTGILAPLAGGLSGLMIFLWVFLLHIPRALADPISLHGNEWTSVLEATAYSGIGFILWRALPARSPKAA